MDKTSPVVGVAPIRKSDGSLLPRNGDSRCPASAPDDAVELVERRHPGFRLGERVRPEAGGGARVVQDEEFEDADPAVVAAGAVRTADGAKERRVGARRARVLEDVGGGLVALAAVQAEATHEALAEHGGETRADDVALDAHLMEARHGARGVPRMQRREDE